MDDGWTVTVTEEEYGVSNHLPRSFNTRTAGPSRERAAVAPSATTTVGFTVSSSCSSQNWQAMSSAVFGLT